ncbi:MAG: threonine ammonia-lyase [Tissierellia bacterium]|nr:threonine ammonia-lyase [Tissierellia bacterium]
MIDISKIYEARDILKEIVTPTPIFTSERIGKNVNIKMENLQKTGSFKIRGAYNKIAHLTPEEAEKGVIACSAGNHAQGVALSATRQGIKSTICIPEGAPLAKVEATKNYGGDVVIVKGVYDDAYNKALEIQKEKDLTFVHPFDDEYVIAGQGTIGLEILEQLPNVKYIVVPIGGGGLIAGIASAVKAIKPQVKIIGVQAEGAPGMKESIDEDEIHTCAKCKTIADGIAVKRPGNLTYEIVKELVDDIVLVSEAEIASTILRLLDENKVAAEGAGAASVAAVIHEKYDFKGEEVCCVLSGGNINANTISKIILTGLYNTGRLAEITTTVEDRPGELIKMLNIIREENANIHSIEQYSSHHMMGVQDYIVRLVVETANEEHIKRIFKKLEDAGYAHYRG